MAMGPQLALSDNHHTVRVMCINETHHAIHHDDHHDHDDEDEDGDEDDMNMSSMGRRLAHHADMNMTEDDWMVMETTDSLDPCGSESCNATCNASSCHPTRCTIHVSTTTTGNGGPVTTDGATHAAYAGAIVPLLSSMLAFLSR
mmetsp:Transcript_43143/g.97139  ORF Transcript_43143/g.97139 Transcript_43143/m.97139 type:complete len:144 (-) Transcript_43143:252-683(-)